jgi:predicted metal-dependent hydrolase
VDGYGCAVDPLYSKPFRAPAPSRSVRRGATALPEIEVRRSARRRRTVSAYRDGDRIVVMLPARFNKSEQREWVDRMVERLMLSEARVARRPHDDAALMSRARDLVDEYLDGRVYPVSVRWVKNMRTRWASCTPVDRTIRISDRLAEMPGWVRDYVLLHELAHLRVAGHGPRFWALVERYERTERARGYLDGVSAAAGYSVAPDASDELGIARRA